MAANVEALLSAAARKYGVPYQIVRAVAIAESGMNPNARSPAGAVGVMQLMPSTAKALGVNPYDVAQNIEGGVRYLKQLYDRFGRWDLAVAAYNAGPGAVEKYKGIPPYSETVNYVRKVMQLAGVAAPSAERQQQQQRVPRKSKGVVDNVLDTLLRKRSSEDSAPKKTSDNVGLGVVRPAPVVFRANTTQPVTAPQSAGGDSLGFRAKVIRDLLLTKLYGPTVQASQQGTVPRLKTTLPSGWGGLFNVF